MLTFLLLTLFLVTTTSKVGILSKYKNNTFTESPHFSDSESYLVLDKKQKISKLQKMTVNNHIYSL